MSAVATAPAPCLRNRLAEIIGALRFGLREFCCPPGAPCGECVQMAADIAALDAGIDTAREAVHSAPTEAAALAVYFDFFAVLAGITVAVEAKAVAAHFGTGGAR